MKMSANKLDPRLCPSRLDPSSCICSSSSKNSISVMESWLCPSLFSCTSSHHHHRSHRNHRLYYTTVVFVSLYLWAVLLCCASMFPLVTSYSSTTTSHLVQTLSAESITLSPRTVTTKYGSIKGNLVKLSSSLSPSTRQRPAQSSSSSSSSQSSSSTSLDLPDVEAYLGVPYATPPTGGLRFMPPVTPTHWRGVRLANKPTPVCPQRIPEENLAAMRSQNESETLKRMTRTRFEYLRRLIPMLGNQSEDCLYLNIYVPLVFQHHHPPGSGRYSGLLLFSLELCL